MRPGMTVRPCRSITRDRGPASLRISADVPSATMRPSRIASASRTDDLRIDREDLAVDEDRVWALRTGQCRAADHDEHEHRTMTIVRCHSLTHRSG